MTFTREERAVIEDMRNKLNSLKETILYLNSRIENIANISDAAMSKKGIRDMSKSELEEILGSLLKNGLLPHNHTSDSQGGPAFAQLGATLIEGETLENSEETP